MLLREYREDDFVDDGWMCVVGRDLEWRRRTELLLLWMRVNSSGTEGSSSGALLVVSREDGSCCAPGVEVEGASYSTSVGRPNAVINAGETIGDAYRFGSGSPSVADLLCLLRPGLANVE